jgi:hypothetical protein
MTSSKKPYAPAKTPSPQGRAGTEKFSDLCRRRTSWDFTNLGTWVVRDIRNKPGVMSQHSAGLALDLQYSDRQMCLNALNWLIANTDELGISLVNDYMFGKYGRTWICDRAAWKIHTTDTIGIRGHWIHIELHRLFADNPTLVETNWRKIPRP